MSWLTDLLKEYPAVAVAKERLAYEEKLHEETKVKNVALQRQVTELTTEVAHLKQELLELRVLEEFTERNGMLWKKSGGGGPYCVKCKGTLTRFGPQFRCPRCD